MLSQCTIEISVETNPALCIETSKSFIEGICKTILTNQGQTLNDDTQLQVLVKRTLEQLITQAGEDLSALAELGRRTVSVAQKIAEIRNNAGFATHGLDIAHPHIDKVFLMNKLLLAYNYPHIRLFSTLVFSLI